MVACSSWLQWDSKVKVPSHTIPSLSHKDDHHRGGRIKLCRFALHPIGLNPIISH